MAEVKKKMGGGKEKDNSFSKLFYGIYVWPSERIWSMGSNW